MNVKSHSFIPCVYVGTIWNKIIGSIYMDELLVIHLCTYMVAVENPTATEIQDVCAAVGLNVFLEVWYSSSFTNFHTHFIDVITFINLVFISFVKKNKMYSREWNRDLQYRGRVRVQLKQEDGSLCLVQFPSRKLFLMNEWILG